MRFYFSQQLRAVFVVLFGIGLFNVGHVGVKLTSFIKLIGILIFQTPDYAWIAM